MAFWNKKKKIENNSTIAISPPEKTCAHSRKDFPWYIETKFVTTYNDSNIFDWEIKEPYVCIYCGERKDITLAQGHKEGISYAAAEKTVENIQEIYKEYLKPRAIVEDMISDFQLVDPQTLYYYEMLHKSTPKTKFSTPSSYRQSTPANSD